MQDFSLSGSTVQAYYICPRQAWLLTRQIIGNQDNDFLAIGRLITDESYKRNKKETLIFNNKIDVIKQKNGELILIEVKKSSKVIDSAKMQLAYYLYILDQQDIKAKGELRIPKEKKVIEVELDEALKAEIKKTENKIMNIINQDQAPKVKKITFCKNCAYKEFCYS